MNRCPHRPSLLPAVAAFAAWAVHPDKLLYEFEHDVFPLCHCKLKKRHRHKLGCFWPAYCELAHVRRVLHRRPLATPRALRAGGPSNREPMALRVAVVGGDRLGDDDEAISRGLPIFMKATTRFPSAATAEP